MPPLLTLIPVLTSAFGLYEGGQSQEKASNAQYQAQLAQAQAQANQQQQQQQQQQAQLKQLAIQGAPDVQNSTGGSLTPGPFAAQDASIIGQPGQQTQILQALSNLPTPASTPDSFSGNFSGGSGEGTTNPDMTGLAFRYAA